MARAMSDRLIPFEPTGVLPIANFPKNGSNRLTEHIIRALRAAVERLRDDADEGDRWLDGVADRRVAAARIPAEKALRREA